MLYTYMNAKSVLFFAIYIEIYTYVLITMRTKLYNLKVKHCVELKPQFLSNSWIVSYYFKWYETLIEQQLFRHNDMMLKLLRKIRKACYEENKKVFSYAFHSVTYYLNTQSDIHLKFTKFISVAWKIKAIKVRYVKLNRWIYSQLAIGKKR